jgi:hypothetical protein
MSKKKVTPSWVAKLNKEFAFVLVGGHQKIARFEGGKFKELMTVDAFKTLVGNLRVKGAAQDKGVGTAWLQHPHRRTYKGITFAPASDAPDGYLNTWQGFAVAAKPGDASPFLEYLRDVTCDGDEKAFRWLLAWLADLVQKPFNKPGTAVVLTGAQGIGKSTLVGMLKHLFGNHAIVLPSAELLTRNFNSHLMSRALVAIEETPIKPRDANLVKQIITADRIVCEPKGVDPFEVDNHLHLIISTNERFAVPAQHDERRYGVFQVSDRQKENTEYFGKRRAWFYKQGGAEVVLHFLQQYDYSGVDLRTAPRTRGLAEQKIANLGPIDRMIYEGLQSGEMLPGLAWGEPLPRTPFVEHVEEQRRKWERPVTADAVGRRLRELFPAVAAYRPSGKTRERYWKLPPLAEARQDFERYLGQPIDWSNTEPDDGESQDEKAA